MTRFTAVMALGAVLLTAACQEHTTSPQFGTPRGVSVQTVTIMGVVAMSDDAAPRLGLRSGDRLIYLAGNVANLDAHMGEAARATGQFDDAGVFVVATYTMDDGGKPGEAAANRAP